MSPKARLLAALLVLGASSPALAVPVGGTLYVKARNTRLMASASPTANALAILQPGQEVKWQGADPKNKQWHRVVAGKQQGVVFQSNLATKPPSLELVAQDKAVRQVDPVAFSNSGAAVKGLSKGAIDYGKGKNDPGYEQAMNQLQELEALAEKIGPSELAAHARKAQLFPVVGPQASTKRGGK
ncbi:SH3 domain-containing protein [Stigmatella sp. ncwal1]|uniref:SH3 domain-containing protein n=1 Tax=Stigmatella ashevillensis TaxID=2995309 RepID=A0ABT5DJP0_9BACT|nr:SH3 domain-containing protein [Stigmatella ashevillena]MDC0712562.1 SH3 domain-containing protein [Stigmatella ashevillena]